MITVVVKEPGKPAQGRKIAGSVESIQEIVGGYFECHKFPGQLTLYCNEGGFGQNKYMTPNVMDSCHPAVLLGTVLVMKGDDGLLPFMLEPVAKRLDQLAVLGHDE